MRRRGAFLLQHASLTLLPRHSGGYSMCLTQGADPGTLTLPSDPAPGRDITAELLAAARHRRGVPVSLDGEGTHPGGTRVWGIGLQAYPCLMGRVSNLEVHGFWGVSLQACTLLASNPGNAFGGGPLRQQLSCPLNVRGWQPDYRAARATDNADRHAFFEADASS